MRIAFDMSSVMWTCLSVGADTEGEKIVHNGRKFQVNTSAYGYEMSVNHIVGMLKMFGVAPKNMIMVFEGMNSKSPRLAISPKYKATRSERPPEMYMAFQELKDRLQQVFGSLGALSLTQDEAEGDDTLGWLAYHTEEDLVIVSGDEDMTVLNGVNSHGATITVCRAGVTGENPYGDWPCQYITVYKAMVGDSRDNIPGIPGFGPAAWKDFMAEFGVAGLAEMARLAELGSLDELVPETANKMVFRIVQGAASFLMSYKLAKLHPEWVNTFDNPLEFRPGLIKGVVTDERLKRWEPTSKLITADLWDNWLLNAMPELLCSDFIALDIETSTPDESDDWLEAQGKEDGAGVDVIGSELTGMSLTYGDNSQRTVYIPVNHYNTNNVDKAVLAELIGALGAAKKTLVIHNYSFEGTVLFNEWGELFKNNGFEGLLPNCLDTKIEASYVDENNSLGLKKLAKRWFNYEQTEYRAVTTIEGVQYKMRDLTGAHVKDYGCDDTIVTGSFHNFAKLFMQLEHTWQVYLDVEIDAMYLHTQSFIHGTKCDVSKVKELEAIDDQTYNTAWATVEKYLVSKGWEGTVCPVYGVAPPPPAEGEEPPEEAALVTPAQVKEAFLITQGVELDTRVRKLAKMADAAEAQGAAIFADFLRREDWDGLNGYVRSKFTAKPTFNTGSPKQLQRLMYETMGLPIRVYNKPTDVARKQGALRGSPKTDTLAMAYAERMDATPEIVEVLSALRLMKMVETRRGLYYSTYPYFVHWKTKRVHSSHNQAATNTRRASSSAPNLQQLAKHVKIVGQAARFREVLVPHKKNAVIVSMDFISQEILLLAEWSRDPILEELFTADPPKDMHSITGVRIFNNQGDNVEISYETFKEAAGDPEHSLHKLCKKYRALGKAINFSGQYRVGAAKMATMLFVSEEEAQAMIDAKAEAFPVSEKWAVDEMEAVHTTGTVRSLLGAVRHLRPALKSKDRYEASKADRQVLSYRIQGSAAEMTKQAEGRMWKLRLEQNYDCEIIAAVHDEVVASVTLEDLHKFIPAMHSCMVANYANMRLPIRSSISFGPSFGIQFEVGNEPTEAAINEGLVELRKLQGATK